MNLKQNKLFVKGIGRINKYRLKVGNSKLHKILIFDLPPGKEWTCITDCPKCYAKKSFRMYPNVKKWRIENYILATEYIETLKYLLDYQLCKFKGRYKYVRIHSSGDFFSNEYLNMWLDIIRNHKTYKFYTYTKNETLFKNKDIPENFNVINSYITIDGKKYINYGNDKYLELLKSKNENLFICPATLNKNVKCGLHCTYCMENKDVIFKIH